MSIRKLVVANGIYFVEIPEAGLHLLCGAPGDSVKHLFRRGIIQTSERNGVVMENGPNAIDVMASDEDGNEAETLSMVNVTP